MAVKEYVQITRSDMAGFDKQCIDLALEAQSLGWVGRMSTQGHMIMRAPDGETTMSVSSRWGNNRSGNNMRANLDRWKKKAHAALGGKTPYEVADDAAREMNKARFIERLTAALLEHIPPSEDPEMLLERIQPVYAIALERPDIAEFAFRCGEEGRVRDFGWMLEYDDDLSAVRPWNVNWAVFDRRSCEVIGFGGPKEYKGQPWNLEVTSLLAVEMMRREREHHTQEADIIGGVLIETDAVEEERPIACELCPRRFKKPMHLARHMSTHKNDDLAFVGVDPGLDDLFTPSESPVVVQMDESLTIVADLHVGEQGDAEQAMATAEALGLAVDALGKVAKRMAMLEGERGQYDALIQNMRREHEDAVTDLQRQVDDLTRERDNAMSSLAALKQIVSDL